MFHRADVLQLPYSYTAGRPHSESIQSRMKNLKFEENQEAKSHLRSARCSKISGKGLCLGVSYRVEGKAQQRTSLYFMANHLYSTACSNLKEDGSNTLPGQVWRQSRVHDGITGKLQCSNAGARQFFIAKSNSIRVSVGRSVGTSFRCFLITANLTKFKRIQVNSTKCWQSDGLVFRTDQRTNQQRTD